MAVSINWLKDYVETNWTPKELAHLLTMAGIAIEGVEEIDGDTLLELDLTPNRGDCLGLINLAREIAALNHSQVKIPALKMTETEEDVNDYIKVEIADADLCYRYAARMIKNVKIKPSPAWLQERLTNSGIRPINNIVDITNYVMLETNQPLHAFDYDLLSPAKKIIVRRAEAGEKITTLDDVERELDTEMLLITDNGRPAALAGVMGGQNTEISEQTVNVLLESACFNNVCIRKTSRKLALRSDSSMRFEKGADVNGVVYAINRAADLMQELGEGEVAAGICDQYPDPILPKQILLRTERVNKLLGTALTAAEIKGLIEDLAFKTSPQENGLLVSVPSYRPDIEIEVDLIEEVARLYGYDRIAASLPGSSTRGALTPYQSFKDKLQNLMARTFFEIVNYSFITPRYFDMLGLAADSPLRQVVKVANPLSEEQSVMRTLLLPGMLDAVSRNLARRNSNLAFYEQGNVFYPRGEGLPEERLKLSAVVAGKLETNWLKQNVEMDFFYLKGILENILAQLGIEYVSYQPAVQPAYHPGRTAVIQADGLELGVIGEVHPSVTQNFGIKPRVCSFELDVDRLYDLSSRRVMMDSITKYPAVERDLALLMQVEIPAVEVMNVIKEAGTELLHSIVLFDVYAGDQVADGFKSMAFRMTFQSKERTLTDTEITAMMEGIIAALEQKLQAALR